MQRVSLWSGALGLALVLLSSVAVADDAKDQSRAAFRRGVTLVKDGDFKSARDKFIEAYRLFAHPSILLNLGITRWRIGEFANAEQDLAKFLSDDGGASQEEITSARVALAAVRGHLGSVRIRVEKAARARFDGQAIALVPGEFAEVRATVGKHVIVAEADGFETKSETIAVESAKPVTVDLVMRALPEGPSLPVVPPVEPPRGIDGRRIAGLVLVGTAALGAGVAVFAGLRARALSAEYNRAPAADQDPGTRATGLAFRTTTDVAIVTAALTASLGVYLLLTPTPNAQAKIAIGPGFTGFQGRF